MDVKGKNLASSERIVCSNISDSDNSALVDMDMDLQAGMGHDDSMFGIDNVGLDFNDFEILNDILPDTPSDSSSEQCLSSPTYMLNSPPSSGLYPTDPALYHAGAQPPVETSIPDLSGVDYDQPLEMIRSAQVMNSFYPGASEGEIVSIPVRNQEVTGTNNNGVSHMVYRDSSHIIKQEPVSSPPNLTKEITTQVSSKPAVNQRKKRRRDPSVPTVEENSSEGSSVQIKSENDDQTQSVHFSPFQATKWRETLTSNLQNLKTPVVKVTADKGFNFSQVDDAFIAQKKNHFQLSCHISKEGEHELVTTESGYSKVEYLQLNFYGVKKEAPEQKIQIEQSQTDRSKKKFFPIRLSFRGDTPMKVSAGRLHFSETTQNNNRKQGKPHPEQRYFHLVVALEAVYYGANNVRMEVPIATLATEKIIVRASNPITFELKQDVSWCKNPNSETIFHHGKVGIGTEHSNEALTVQGNIQVAGDILSPSDIRIKKNIAPVDTKKQLENLQKIQVVEFMYKPEYLHGFSDQERSVMDKKQMGVIAQDVRRIIPDAVENAGDVSLENGENVPNMLIVNKDRLFLENIGAVRELSKLTDNLGQRIDELETHTVRMSNLNRFGSIKSTGNGSVSSTSSKYKSSKRNRKEGSIFRNGWIQGAILCLVGIMTICLLAMAILYILDYQRRLEDDDNISDIPSNITTSSYSTTPPTVVVTTRSSHQVNTKKGLSTSTTTRMPYRSISTSTPVRIAKVINQPKQEIGSPRGCPGVDPKRSCQSFCTPSTATDLPPDTVLIDDNTLSGPGPETSSPNSEAVTELPDHLNQILPSGSEESEEQQDNTAVRRAVPDTSEDQDELGPGNADNEVLLARSNSAKPVNFVAEQLGEERMKKLNELNGRLPRNRNYVEGVDKIKLDQRLNLNVNEENEIIEEDGENSKNITNSDTVEVEESRSSHGKKSSKLIGTPNEVRQSFKQKNLSKDSTNLIVDSVKPQARRGGSDISLRRKRNLPDSEDLSSENRASQPVTAACLEAQSEVRVRTQAGTVPLTEAYCEDCQSSANNCSYEIPLSKHMPDTQIALLFHVPVEQCHPLPHYVSHVDNDVQGLEEESFQVFIPVPAGQNVTQQVFRISPGSQSSNLCQKTSPPTFVQINVRVYRVC